MEILLMEQLSMTLTEIDKLKKKDPERLYRFYYFVIEKMKAEKREMDKIKDKSTGGSDTLILEEREEDKEMYSEIPERSE